MGIIRQKPATLIDRKLAAMTPKPDGGSVHRAAEVESPARVLVHAFDDRGGARSTYTTRCFACGRWLRFCCSYVKLVATVRSLWCPGCGATPFRDTGKVDVKDQSLAQQIRQAGPHDESRCP